MYNYHPKFCYGTHTTHGQKVYFYILFLKTVLSSRVLDLIFIFRVLEYSVCIPYFRIFRVFRHSVPWFHDFTIPPDRVSPCSVNSTTCPHAVMVCNWKQPSLI